MINFYFSVWIAIQMYTELPCFQKHFDYSIFVILREDHSLYINYGIDSSEFLQDVIYWFLPIINTFLNCFLHSYSCQIILALKYFSLLNYKWFAMYTDQTAMALLSIRPGGAVVWCTPKPAKRSIFLVQNVLKVGFYEGVRSKRSTFCHKMG